MTALDSDDPLSRARRLAAYGAADVCREAAVAVRSTAEQRAADATGARDCWEGPHRRAFDEADAAARRRAAALEAAARALAARFEEVAEPGGGW
ncbi:MAG: hypothetical protein ABIV94_01645 [Acidimicrobiales bacterium]